MNSLQALKNTTSPTESPSDRQARIKRERATLKAERDARKRAKKDRSQTKRGLDGSESRPPPPLPPPPPLASPPPPSNTPLVGLVGCGSWFSLKHHQKHLSKLHGRNRMSLKAIYSPTAASTKKCLANLAKLNIPNDSLPTPYHDQGEHDQCSPYDDKGTSSPSSPSLPPLSFFTNLTIIIVTVPIHVLPVLLEHIAELELDPPPHIITEKPALPTTPNATLLAALQSYTGNIAVLENWLTRPCYHRFKTRLTTTSLPTPPCSYTFEITQTLDTTSWRADGASSYRGGGCRDVGESTS